MHRTGLISTVVRSVTFPEEELVEQNFNVSPTVVVFGYNTLAMLPQIDQSIAQVHPASQSPLKNEAQYPTP